MKARTPWILGIATSILMSASFPKIDQGWLILFALVPWLVVIFSPRGLKTKVAVTAVTFFLFFIFSFEWIRYTSYLGFLPFIVLLTVDPIIFCLLVHALGSRKLLSSSSLRRWIPALAAPLLWAVVESFRGVLFKGFPWLLLSHALYETPVAQAVGVIGCNGLSFVVAALNCALAFYIASMMWPDPRGKVSSLVPERVYVAAAVLVIIVCWAYGAVKLTEETPGSVIRVGVVQSNAGKNVRRDSKQAVSLLDLHIDLSRGLGPCDIIVWPETSVPVRIEEREELKRRISTFAIERKAYLLIGGLGITDGQSANSTFLISPEGKFLDRYDKVHLVPFGEYIPYPRLFGAVARSRVHYKKPFIAGSEMVVFNAGGIPFSTVICFEVIFSDLLGRARENGARLIINMTSEGWFGTGAELQQHLAIARMKAIELRIPIVRVANTGISAYIDPMGRVTRSPSLVTNTPGVEVFSVNVP